MTDLSIIIVSYNTKNVTKKCLETVIESLKADPTIKVEIIVIDNNSTDGSAEMLKAVSSQLSVVSCKIVTNKQNLGFSRANNRAAKMAQGQYLLFLNSDTEAIDDAVPALYDFFKNQNEFHFAGGKLLNKDGSAQASCGPMFSLSVIFAFLFLRGDYYSLTRYSPDSIKQVDWVSGACIMTKKEYFTKVGGFDQSIFMYMEEVEFFYRVAKKGFKVEFLPQASFIHLGSASSPGRTQPILQVYKGLIYFYKKHHPDLPYKILKTMLQLKALISVFIGKLAGNQYLLKTYAEAYKIAKET